ncbi:MAG: response regulator [Oscillatoria sp. SIO1A7]|nr:response regulator [Oscillatoria sp. SIO1A7]
MKKPAIICIDDEPTVLESLKIELKKAIGDECIIETSEGGEEALELFEELLEDDYEIALVVSDYIMPDIKGDEVLKRMHALSPNTLKIMLTGQADLEALGNAIKNARLYRYIPKPWHTEDLRLTVIEAVHSYLQDKKLTEQNLKVRDMNEELEQLTREQAALIAQLHENENRLMQFLEAMPVGVGVLDANGNPYFLNQKAKDLFGKGALPDVNPDRLSEVYRVYKAGTDSEYPPEDLPIVRALQGESATADDLEIRQEDKVIPVESWGTPIYDEEGNIVYAINAIQDITDRKKAEADRERFTYELFEINQSYSRFVPRQFLQMLEKQSILDVQLGDHVLQEQMSVLFSDIRDFTALSETMTPEENFTFINSYLSRMEPAIIENQGFIDKYIGDAIMALFSGGADGAVKAAIAMLHRLAEYNLDRVQSGYPPIRNGIGINTGSLMLGTIGGSSRMDSTAISDTVNLASRVEDLTKNYGVSLLITHHTFSRLQNPADYAIRIIDRVKVKGKSKTVSVFEVFDADPPEVQAGKFATRMLFEEAMLFYYQRNCGESAKIFQECLRVNPGDRVAAIYLERCQQYMG